MPDVVSLKGIEFKIVYDTSSAEEGIQRLADALKELRESFGNAEAKETAKAFDSIGSSAKQAAAEVAKVKHESRGTANSAKNTSKLATAYEKLQKVAGGAGKKIGSFFSSIGRIAMYRAIRTGLKMLSQAIITGTNNFYEFSKAMGGKFAQSMDKLTTQFETLENSVGVVVAQFIQAFEPAITAITDALIEFNNELSKIIAIGAGEDSYYKATKSAKELAKAQRSLLGFDELNILKGSSDSSDNFEKVNINPGEKVKGNNWLQNMLLDDGLAGEVSNSGLMLGEVFAGAFIGKAFGPTGILAGAGIGAFVGLTTHLTGKITAIWDDAEGEALGFFDDLKTLWNGFLEDIGLSSLGFGEEWDAFWQMCADSLRFIFKGTFSLLTGDFAGFWEEIKKSGASMIDFIIQQVLWPINATISMINTAIDGINNIPGVNIPHIPKIEPPSLRSTLDNKTSGGGQQNAAAQTAQYYNGQYSSNFIGPIPEGSVYMDGEKVGSIVTKHQNQSSRMTGVSVMDY